MTDDAPPPVRRLSTRAAARLAALSAIFDDLQTVLRCCELLLPADEQDRRRGRDPAEREALWTTALISYARCFTVEGKDALTQDDLTSTPLEGEVVEWHKMLQRLHGHFADPKHNPRGQFSVGAATRADGTVEAVAVTSTAPIGLDEQTVRQTGAVALELSKLVDGRITEQQEKVMAEATAMSKDALEELPLIEVSAPAM